MTGVTGRTLREAAATLARDDPVVAALAERYGTPPSRPRVSSALRFAALVRSIVYQQLAGNAAAAIHGRLATTLNGEVSAEAVLASSPEELSSCGLSRTKATAIIDLATKYSSGQLSLERIGRLSDEEVIEHLVQVRGIGRWTAEMFLITSLGRLDIWPVGDYGVRAGYGRGWRLDQAPTPSQLLVLGERYRPFRSVVAWYCWRVADDRAFES